jgi:hypothetical protein
MSFFGEEFTVDTLPVSDNKFEPLPAGWYTATITGAEVKKTKAGTGEKIDMKYTITGPTHQGRIIFGNLNIRNPNPKAEEIARQQLGEIMRAIGLSKISDSDQLIGGNLQIKLTIKKSEEYGDSNDVNGFKAIDGKAVNIVAGKPASTSAGTPPWGKK